MSANDAAIAAFRSASSSSSGSGFFDAVPFGFDCDFSCACDTNPDELLPFASSRLISNARFKSASKLSSTRGLRGSIEPWYSVLFGFGASNRGGAGVPRDRSVSFA